MGKRDWWYSCVCVCVTCFCEESGHQCGIICKESGHPGWWLELFLISRYWAWKHQMPCCPKIHGIAAGSTCQQNGSHSDVWTIITVTVVLIMIRIIWGYLILTFNNLGCHLKMRFLTQPRTHSPEWHFHSFFALCMSAFLWWLTCQLQDKPMWMVKTIVSNQCVLFCWQKLWLQRMTGAFQILSGKLEASNRLLPLVLF